MVVVTQREKGEMAVASCMPVVNYVAIAYPNPGMHVDLVVATANHAKSRAITKTYRGRAASVG